MFGAAVPGFMSAAESIDDAGTTLRAHQSAVMTAMHAVLKETLDRLDPVTLEQQVKGHTVLDTVMAANRKAKCWTHYCEQFQAASTEAGVASGNAFNANFVRAYGQAISDQQEQIRAGEKSKPAKTARHPAKPSARAPRR